jgi:hypothetical protein
MDVSGIFRQLPGHVPETANHPVRTLAATVPSDHGFFRVMRIVDVIFTAQYVSFRGAN